MKILRFLTIVANFLSLGFIWYLALSSGVTTGQDWLVLVGITIFLIFNLYFIISNNKENDLLSLWFQRKSLEEQKKIDNLQKNDSN